MDELMVTIPLSQYTEMVRKLQKTEDQLVIDQLKLELQQETDRYSKLLVRVYKAEDRLKEVKGEKAEDCWDCVL